MSDEKQLPTTLGASDNNTPQNQPPSGPPPGPPVFKSQLKTKKTFPTVKVKEEGDFQSILEQRKKFINTSSNFATKTTEEKTTILKKSKIKLTVVWGDLTKENTQCIVNAANTNMLHIGGLAKIIVTKGGNNDIIQTESIANIHKQGFKNSVPVGENIYTSGGDLKCEYVIHSVGPMWFGGEKNEFENLEKCMVNIFKTSEKLKIKSISIPAISTGIYGFPLEKYCEIVFDVILKTFEKESVETDLKEIRLTNIDEKTTKTIVQEFEKQFK
eukprot:gene7053-11216_t